MIEAAFGPGGLGARINCARVRCSLGWLVVGLTERGICSLALGDDPDQLLEDLLRVFPNADLESSHDPIPALCARLIGVVDHGEDGRDLPLEVVATGFQWGVWRAMRNIPSGETRSYSELAQMAGHPGAARAVGTACARNPVSLLIPCHRVIRADGSTGNYAWGNERKVSLLNAEASSSTWRSSARPKDSNG
ncbi:MAG: methylated-DNA--[protein]-cysteine S-methyltransferase [Solirubrobacterales bacterium]